MDVAVVSVVVTGLVAVATIGGQVYNSAAQRRHETEQSHEDRVWEHKRATLLELIRSCLELKRLLNDIDVAFYLSEEAPRLEEEVQPVVAAYGSEELRKALGALLREVNVWQVALDTFGYLGMKDQREKSRIAIEKKNYVEALSAAQEQGRYAERVKTSLSDMDRKSMRSLLDDVLEKCRKDLGSETA